MASGVEPRPGGDELVRSVTRRNFIVWYLAGLLTATVVAVVAPILVFLYPPAGANKQKRLTIKLDRPLSDLAEGDALKFASPAESGFLMEDGGGDNRPGAIAFSGYAVKASGGTLDVFAVNCSHLGCSVEFKADAGRFDCPCHGSRFSLSGQVVHGPAVYPLSHLSWVPGDSPNEILVIGLSLPGVG